MWDRLVFLCFPSSFPYDWCLFYSGERRWYAFTDNLWKSNPCKYTCVWSFLKVGILDCNEDDECPFWCAFVCAFICALKSTESFNIQVGCWLHIWLGCTSISSKHVQCADFWAVQAYSSVIQEVALHSDSRALKVMKTSGTFWPLQQLQILIIKMLWYILHQEQQFCILKLFMPTHFNGVNNS